MGVHPSRREARRHRGGVGFLRSRAVRIGLVLGLVWVAAGFRILGPEQFGVLESPLLGQRLFRVEGRWALAPPGLFSLSTYPRVGVELRLPGAERAMLRARDGSRFGLRGWATVRPIEESWARLHRCAEGEGLDGLMVRAVREAGAALPPGVERGPVTAHLARDLERRLSEALAERGLALRRLEIQAFDFLAALPEGEEPPTGTRLLVVGLDGADWEILDPLLQQGRMPHLAGLIDSGARGKLLSLSPLLSPVIWTTVATGVEPSRHGVLDFLVEDAEGVRQPVTSAQRRVPTLWEILSRSGIDVGVVGWWASWPADPVRGYLVSDRLAYQLFGFRADPEVSQGKSWPPELYDDLRPLVRIPESVGWDEVEPYLDRPVRPLSQFDDEDRRRLNEFRTVLAAGETYLEIGKLLRSRFRPELEVIYFEGTDTVGHLFMPYRPPRLPGVEGGEAFSEVVNRYYETADRFLGELLEGRDESWTVLVLSDHGFASDATRPRTSDSRIGHGGAVDWHRRFGIVVLSGANVRAGVQLEEASVYDIAPTILTLFGQAVPRSWPGRVLGPALDERFLERYPVRYRADDPERSAVITGVGEDPALGDLLEKLQSLGYISPSEETPDSVTALNNSGVALLAEGRYAEAEAEFRRGLEAAPDTPLLVVNLGLALRLQGRIDEAERAFERAVAEPSTTRLAAHQLAQIQMDRGELAPAEELLRRILASEPDAADLRNTLGLVLEGRGEADEAEACFRRAADDDPDAAMPRNNLGNLLKRAGRLDAAEEWYRKAIEADPYFMGAYNNLALLYQLRGQMEMAIDLYGRAMVRAPHNAVVQNNLASLYYAQGDLEEARRLWRQAAMADPDYPSPLNNLASLEIHAQRFDEAERLLRRALELEPGYGDARLNLSLVLTAREDFEGARRELHLATEDPRSAGVAWYKLGLFELEFGPPEGAVRSLERARALAQPLGPELLNALGEAHLQVGNTAAAVEAWTASLDLEPDQPMVRQVLENPPWEE